MNKIKILSIDGGGIRGILPGIILDKLEQKLRGKKGFENKRLADVFDFMAGTSTGGILTLLYLTPDKTGLKPRYSANDAVGLYLERGSEIFDLDILQRLKSGFGVTDEKYNSDNMEAAFFDSFGNANFDKLLKPCIITSYNIEEGKPHFFSQHKAKDKRYNFALKDIARATSAAPTYFEVANIMNKNGDSFGLIDGGVFANNPALVAYSEARSMNFAEIKKPAAKDMMIVSIGTGSESEKYSYNETKDWGTFPWIKPIINIMMSASSETVHFHLRKMYETLSVRNSKNYYRIEPRVLTADKGMDNATSENINRLKNDALTFLSDEMIDEKLDEIVVKLTQFASDSK